MSVEEKQFRAIFDYDEIKMKPIRRSAYRTELNTRMEPMIEHLEGIIYKIQAENPYSWRHTRPYKQKIENLKKGNHINNVMFRVINGHIDLKISKEEKLSVIEFDHLRNCIGEEQYWQLNFVNRAMLFVKMFADEQHPLDFLNTVMEMNNIDCKIDVTLDNRIIFSHPDGAQIFYDYIEEMCKRLNAELVMKKLMGEV